MKTFALLVSLVVCSVGGVAQATDVVLVAPAATFAVPTVVGAVVTPAFIAPQAVAVTPVVVAQRVVVRQPVRTCVRALLRR